MVGRTRELMYAQKAETPRKARVWKVAADLAESKMHLVGCEYGYVSRFHKVRGLPSKRKTVMYCTVLHLFVFCERTTGPGAAVTGEEGRR